VLPFYRQSVAAMDNMNAMTGVDLEAAESFFVDKK